MLREMRLKLSSEIGQLSHELNVVIPQAIAHAVELGDLRENSEYKAALERQQFVQARLGQLHQRLSQLQGRRSKPSTAGTAAVISQVDGRGDPPRRGREQRLEVGEHELCAAKHCE